MPDRDRHDTADDIDREDLEGAADDEFEAEEDEEDEEEEELDDSALDSDTDIRNEAGRSDTGTQGRSPDDEYVSIDRPSER